MCQPSRCVLKSCKAIYIIEGFCTNKTHVIMLQLSGSPILPWPQQLFPVLLGLWQGGHSKAALLAPRVCRFLLTFSEDQQMCIKKWSESFNNSINSMTWGALNGQLWEPHLLVAAVKAIDDPPHAQAPKQPSCNGWAKGGILDLKWLDLFRYSFHWTQFFTQLLS